MACGGGAEIAEDEVLGHAVVKLSHEKLLVKEQRAHQEVEYAAAGPDAGRGRRPQSRERDETPSTAAASASFNTDATFLARRDACGRLILAEYPAYHHQHRPHQEASDNRPLTWDKLPSPEARSASGEVVCEERLGGLRRHSRQVA